MFDSLETWLASQGMTLLGTIVKTAIIVVAGCLLIKFTMSLIDKMLNKSKLEKAAHALVKTLAKTVMYILLALIVASSLGIDVTGVVALASVVTLAVSLSLQNMLANVVGGFTLLYTRPFSSGDYVEIAGQSGTVREIGMTYTKLQTPDNKLTYIPNSAVVSAEIVNYTVLGTRRLTVEIGVSYDMPAQKVIDTLVGCVDSRALTEPEKPYAVLTGYGESRINYQLRLWVNGDDYWNVNFDLNQKIKTVFEQEGIQFSYPHLNVHLDK